MTADRRVRLLRLHAHDDAAVRRGALLVEDALRTASLPGADRGRLYLVRRLSLGAIDPSLPPAAIAVEIERRFVALRVTAVHAESDGAASARAVYFHDDVEPFVLLARRVAAGAAVSAWFWPLAVRGYTPSLPAPKALEVALAGALDTPAGAAAVVRMTAELGEAALDALCGALRPGTGEALLLRCNWGAPPAVARELGRGAPALGGIARLAPPWPRVLRRWVARWGAADARAVWLAAVAACAGSPALAADPRLSARGAQLALMAARSPEVGPAADEPAADAAASRPPIEAPRAEQPELEVEIAAPRAAGVRPDAAPMAGAASSADVVAPSAEPVRPAMPAAMPAAQPGSAISPASPAASTPTPTRPFAAPSGAAASVAASPSAAGEDATAPRRGRSSGREPLWHGVPMATAAGGLPLVIRPLMRLGIADWLRDHPAAVRGGFPVRLMGHIGAWCGVSPDDPALAVFDLPAEPLPELAAEPPEVWRHVFGEATWQALSRRPAGAPATWRLAVSLWLRRVARLPLGRVVRRPGRVVATRTHVDVLFPLAAADVRVRAAALDVNPGWVPWLGRIVQFHYLEEV